MRVVDTDNVLRVGIEAGCSVGCRRRLRSCVVGGNGVGARCLVQRLLVVGVDNVLCVGVEAGRRVGSQGGGGAGSVLRVRHELGCVVCCCLIVGGRDVGCVRCETGSSVRSQLVVGRCVVRSQRIGRTGVEVRQRVRCCDLQRLVQHSRRARACGHRRIQQSSAVRALQRIRPSLLQDQTVLVEHPTKLAANRLVAVHVVVRRSHLRCGVPCACRVDSVVPLRCSLGGVVGLRSVRLGGCVVFGRRGCRVVGVRSVRLDRVVVLGRCSCRVVGVRSSRLGGVVGGRAGCGRVVGVRSSRLGGVVGGRAGCGRVVGGRSSRLGGVVGGRAGGCRRGIGRLGAGGRVPAQVRRRGGVRVCCRLVCGRRRAHGASHQAFVVWCCDLDGVRRCGVYCKWIRYCHGQPWLAGEELASSSSLR